MLARTLSKIIFAVFTLQLLFIAAKGWETEVDYYVLQHQRQYNANIIDYELRLGEFQAVYDGELSTIDIQLTSLDNRLQQTANELLALQKLSNLTKHCVQTYGNKLYNNEQAKIAVATCARTGGTNVNYAKNTPTNTANTLRNYYDYQLPAALDSCKRSNPIASEKYNQCVIQAIASANTYTENNQKTFADNMQSARRSADTAVQTAIECSFNIFYNAVGSIHETEFSVNNCIANNGKVCASIINTPSETACPNFMDLVLSDSDFSSTTINNPFYGMNPSMGCIRVNFV